MKNMTIVALIMIMMSMFRCSTSNVVDATSQSNEIKIENNATLNKQETVEETKNEIKEEKQEETLIAYIDESDDNNESSNDFYTWTRQTIKKDENGQFICNQCIISKSIMPTWLLNWYESINWDKTKAFSFNLKDVNNIPEVDKEDTKLHKKWDKENEVVYGKVKIENKNSYLTNHIKQYKETEGWQTYLRYRFDENPDEFSVGNWLQYNKDLNEFFGSFDTRDYFICDIENKGKAYFCQLNPVGTDRCYTVVNGARISILTYQIYNAYYEPLALDCPVGYIKRINNKDELMKWYYLYNNILTGADRNDLGIKQIKNHVPELEKQRIIDQLLYPEEFNLNPDVWTDNGMTKFIIQTDDIYYDNYNTVKVTAMCLENGVNMTRPYCIFHNYPKYNEWMNVLNNNGIVIQNYSVNDYGKFNSTTKTTTTIDSYVNKMITFHK